MKKFASALMAMLINGMLLSFLSCSEQDDLLSNVDDFDGLPADTVMKTCDVVFNVNLTEFDQTRASFDNWANGDKIYLTFDNSAYGVAEYNLGVWSINYYGTLTIGNAVGCRAIYFENPYFENENIVKLAPTTGIYEDLNAMYAFDGTTLFITAFLAPKTGRIRFKGTSEVFVMLFGITYMSSFDISTGLLSSTQDPISLFDLDSTDGYTPYIYGYFTDSESPQINIMYPTSVGMCGFSRPCSTEIFNAGESGYMDFPTESSHSGWINRLVFKIGDVEFSMIPVVYENTLFYLGETEVTEGLYAEVMKTTTSKNNHPQIFRNHSDCATFIDCLNTLIGFEFIEFRLATNDEWQYAAKGGNQSQGYTYSGSAYISEVAWYDFNSNAQRHDVAQLQPNELGFYDMSGNLEEWTSSSFVWKDDNNTYYYCLGGSYCSTRDECTSSSKRAYIDNSSSTCGLRLALSFLM